MAYGIGQEIEDLTELGVDELTRRQSINPQLKYALALQEASNLVNAAARERDIAMEQEEPPQVIGQLEQSLAQRLTPGVEQMIQQQPQQPPMQQGVSGVPAPNMMMSGGGIVSFADGGELVEGITEVGQQAIGKEKQVSWLDRLLERVFPERSDAEKEAFENRPRPGSDEWREQQYISSGGIPTPYMRGEDAERFRRNFGVPTLGGPALLPETETFLNATEILDNPESTAEQKAFAQMQLEGLKDAPMRAEMLQQVDKIRSARRGMARGGIVGLANGGPLATPEQDFEIMLDKEGITDTRERAFARAIYAAESSSGTHPDTWKDRGEGRPIGLMQIGADAFEDVADEGWNRLNAEHNMRAGIRYAMEGYRKAGGNPEAGGAYYYGGPQGLKAWARGEALSDRDQPSFPDTLQYGREIAETMPSYIQQDEDILAARSSVADEQANILKQVGQGVLGLVEDAATGAKDFVSDKYAQAQETPRIDDELSRIYGEGLLGEEVLAEADVPQSYDVMDPTNERFRQAAALEEGDSSLWDRVRQLDPRTLGGPVTGPDRSGFSIDGVKSALVNLLDLDPRQPETDTYTDAAGNVYPTNPTDAQRMRQAFPQLAARSDAEQEADAEAEMDLLDAAQGRSDPNPDGFLTGLRRGISAINPFGGPAAAGQTTEIEGDLTDAERMRQAFPQWAEVSGAEQEADAQAEMDLLDAAKEAQDLANRTPLERARAKEKAALRALNEFNRHSRDQLGADAIFDDDIRTAVDAQAGALRREYQTALASTQRHIAEEERLATIATVEGMNLLVSPDLLVSHLTPEDNAQSATITATDEVVTTDTDEVVTTDTDEVVTTDTDEADTESGDPVSALLEGEEVDTGAVTDQMVYGDTLISSTDEEVTTPTGSQYTIKSTSTEGTPGSASSIQGRYDQLTQPQSRSEAFFDLLKTLGGGGGRSEGYEFAGISERGAELDAARREEAMGIIDAETRQRAIDAQGQTDQRRFVRYYIEANRGAGKTDAQLGVEASQIYLRASNIYAGQTNRMAEYSEQVANITNNLTNPLTLAYNRAVRSEGAESSGARAAFQQILQQAQEIYEAGKEVIGP